VTESEGVTGEVRVVAVRIGPEPGRDGDGIILSVLYGHRPVQQISAYAVDIFH